MSDAQMPLAWLPFSIAEASITGKPGSDDMELPQAWSYLLNRLGEAAQVVQSNPVKRNQIDLASGIRHLLVLLAAGVDEALRFDPDPVLGVERTRACLLIPDCGACSQD